MENSDKEELDFFTINDLEVGTRLDKVLFNRFGQVHSRTYFQYLIDQEKVLVNGNPIKKRYIPKLNDEIQINYIITPQTGLLAENIPLNVVYEDEHLIVVNKKPGMVVHPAPGHPNGTFVNALLYHCQNGYDVSQDDVRPGIVHRLDKDTSGLIVAAKTNAAHKKLIEMFSGREIHKEYLAICYGNPGNQTIKEPIGRHPIIRQKMKVLKDGGRPSISVCETLVLKENISLVKVDLKTGRTHQIRVHMQHLHAPVLGDALYGNEQANKRYGAKRQLLHAHLLKFNHPITQKPLEFKAECPEDMQHFIDKLYRAA